MKGYKGMLRDRLPETVSIALKWCNAKTAWVDHAYERFVGIYISNEERHNAAKIVLGLKEGKQTQFDFQKTIDWENLTDNEKEYWDWVFSWVRWFQNNGATLFNYAELSNGDVNKFKQDLNAFIKMEDKKEELINHLIKYVFRTNN